MTEKDYWRARTHAMKQLAKKYPSIKDAYEQSRKDRVKAAKKFIQKPVETMEDYQMMMDEFRAENSSNNERKVANMSTNDAMEITKRIVKGNRVWEFDPDYMEAELMHDRKALLQFARTDGQVLLNKAYDWLGLENTREGLTTGWEFNIYMKPEDLFTWSFSPDHDVEVTFHNLKDISNLYPAELTLSVSKKLKKEL